MIPVTDDTGVVNGISGASGSSKDLTRKPMAPMERSKGSSRSKWGDFSWPG